MALKKKITKSNIPLIEEQQQIYRDAEARGDTAAMEAAHKEAERIRASDNYSGGADGSQYINLQSSPPRADSYYKGYADYYYNQYKDRQSEGLAAYQNSVYANMNNRIKSADYAKKSIYEDHNQAYRDMLEQKAASEKTLPTSLSKLGLYGSGSGETAVANMNNAYQQEYSKMLSEKNRKLADIENQKQQIMADAQADIQNMHANMLLQDPQVYNQLLQDEARLRQEKIDNDRVAYQFEANRQDSNNQYDTTNQLTVSENDKDRKLQLDITNLNIDAQKALETLRHNFDLETISVQQRNDLEKLAAQHGYTLEEMVKQYDLMLRNDKESIAYQNSFKSGGKAGTSFTPGGNNNQVQDNNNQAKGNEQQSSSRDTLLGISTDKIANQGSPKDDYVVVGNTRYSFAEVTNMYANGEVVLKKNSDGSYTIKKK